MIGVAEQGLELGVIGQTPGGYPRRCWPEAEYYSFIKNYKKCNTNLKLALSLSELLTLI